MTHKKSWSRARVSVTAFRRKWEVVTLDDAPISLEAASLTDTLSQVMRGQIISGKLEPGRRITESWVAETFSVARPTAKSGLERLTNEGLLRRSARRSAVVPLLTAEDVIDIYYSRESVEMWAVRTLAERSDSTDAARRALRMMTRAAEDGDLIAHIEADIDFHRELVSATGSTRLKRMHETIMGEAQLCIAQVQANVITDLAVVANEHAAILDGIAAGDPDAAIRALQTDLHGAREYLLADLSNQRKASDIQSSPI
jgi:DNA-binding GntR family transcriptional regulator